MRVLVYGDSNSWGYLADGLGVRCARRWPCVMAEETGWEVIEDCLPGRTSTHDDPQMAEAEPSGAAWNGLSHVEAAMLSASPLDLVLIMLGTNDLKTRFAPDVDKVADNILRVATRAGKVCAGPGAWDDTRPPKVAVIAPVPLGGRADDHRWERATEWQGARAISNALYQAITARAGDMPVLDAGRFAAASARDPIHLDADQHIPLGQGIARWAMSLL